MSASATAPPASAIEALLDGTHADPFSILGTHAGPEGTFARALLPGAEEAGAYSLKGGFLGAMKRVLYACDPSRLKTGSELALLAALLSTFGAQLDVLHVFEGDRDEARRKRVEQVIATALPGVTPEFRYLTHQKVDDGIRECVHRYPTGLLAMLSHELGFWESVTTGSHTRAMTVTTRVPLLVLPGGAR